MSERGGVCVGGHMSTHMLVPTHATGGVTAGVAQRGAGKKAGRRAQQLTGGAKEAQGGIRRRFGRFQTCRGG